MAVISLNGIEFHAHHGIHETERELGNNFLVDISLNVNVREAAIKDDLDHTLDYEKVYYVIAREMAIPSNLLEHVAKRILLGLDGEFDNVKDIIVTVSKLNPPLPGKCEKASVTVSLGEGLTD